MKLISKIQISKVIKFNIQKIYLKYFNIYGNNY